MTFRKRGNTRSGVPGRSRRWRRNRYPSLWATRRTASSGLVSTLRMRRMRALRWCDERRSIMRRFGCLGVRGCETTKPTRLSSDSRNPETASNGARHKKLQINVHPSACGVRISSHNTPSLRQRVHWDAGHSAVGIVPSCWTGRHSHAVPAPIEARTVRPTSARDQPTRALAASWSLGFVVAPHLHVGGKIASIVLGHYPKLAGSVGLAHLGSGMSTQWVMAGSSTRSRWCRRTCSRQYPRW